MTTTPPPTAGETEEQQHYATVKVGDLAYMGRYDNPDAVCEAVSSDEYLCTRSPHTGKHVAEADRVIVIWEDE